MKTSNPNRVAPGAATTVEYSGSVVSSDPDQRAKIQLVVGPKGVGDDVRQALHKRMRFAASLGVFLYLYLVADAWLPFDRQSGITWAFLAWVHIVLLGEAASVIVLWRRPRLTLSQLRFLEVILLLLPLVHLLLYDVDRLFILHSFVQHAEGGNWHDTSRAGVFPWFIVLVVYGILIPNTWRRCALVLGTVLVIPLGMNLAAAISDGVIFHRSVAIHFVEMVVWLAFGAAFVVYNAHRIDTLWAQSEQARELGHYRLSRQLGHGGMGEVYLAEHVLLRRPCAVKLIRPERAGDVQNLRRFEREVKATATLTHPNTVQIFDYGHAEDGTFYYVMEYLPGLTLEELVRRHGPLAPARAVYILRQLCGALREAHAIGLIHRDIKPGNVMICQRGGLHDTAKLLDFGLCQIQDRTAEDEKLTKQGTIAGTPAYMSPEQADGQEALDARTDIYSLGALAYLTLTGRSPFAGRSPLKMLAAHVYETPDPLTKHSSDMPDDLQAVVLRCLAKDQKKRFSGAESLEDALAACRCAGQWSQKQAAAWWASLVEEPSPK